MMGNIPVGGPHQPANTYQNPEVDASKSQAKIGEHSVSASPSSRLNDGAQPLNHKISSFFEGNSNRPSSWSAQSSEATQQEREGKAEVAAQEFFSNLKDGQLSAAYDNLVKIHDAAHGQTGDDPQQVIGAYLQNAAAGLSPDDLQALQSRDFEGDSARLVNGHLSASVMSVQTLESLIRSDLAGPDDLRAQIGFTASMTSEIPAALNLVRDVVSSGAATRSE